MYMFPYIVATTRENRQSGQSPTLTHPSRFVSASSRKLKHPRSHPRQRSGTPPPDVVPRVIPQTTCAQTILSSVCSMNGGPVPPG